MLELNFSSGLPKKKKKGKKKKKTLLCQVLIDNELPRKDHTSSFLTYGEAGKRVLKFQANFRDVFEVLSSNDGSNFIQIRLAVSNLLLT